MSETGVNSNINSLRRQLGHELQEIRGVQLHLAATVEQVSANQDLARGELTELRELVDGFVARFEQVSRLQLAQSQVIEVALEIEQRFGHHDEVRRLATGTLQGMDTGIVTQETMQDTAEELMITNPRYWLAPAIVALAAWIRDDRPLAEKALGEALRRDDDKAALFFALVLRRQQRDEAAARWLRQYVARQDPQALSREFTVVLDAAATGALGPAAKPMVVEHLTGWYTQLTQRPDVVEQQVVRWAQLLDGMRTPVPPSFEVLPRISPTWPLMRQVYEGATVHRAAEGHFRRIFERPLRPDPGLAHRVDDILGTLVSRFDDEEGPLRVRKDELDALIRHDGDIRAARADVDAAAPVHADTVDFLTLVTNAAHFPDRVGASDGTQRLATALAKDWIVEADGRLQAANLQAVPAGVDLVVDTWQGRIEPGVSEPQLLTSVAAHVDAETRAQVEAVRFDALPYAIGGAVLTAVVGILLAAGGGGGAAAFFLLVMLGIGGWGLYRYSRLQPLKDRIRHEGEARRERAVATVRGAVAEFVDWRQAWDQENRAAEPLCGYVGALDRDAHVTGNNNHRRAGVR